jgi:hypothetical protein
MVSARAGPKTIAGLRRPPITGGHPFRLTIFTYGRSSMGGRYFQPTRARLQVG